MKKIITVALCLLVIACLFAQEMTAEQKKIYDSKALSVYPQVDDSETSYYRKREPSLVSKLASTINWDAYQGKTKISKAKLFNIAGYPEQKQLCLDVEKKNAKNKAVGIALTTTGVVGCIVGTILILKSSSQDFDGENFREGIAMLEWGALVSVLSCIPLGFGVSFIEKSNSEPDIEASFAMSVATIYNQELQASIMLNY